MSNPVPKLILHSDQTLNLTGARDAELLKSLSGKKNPRIIYIPSATNARLKNFDEKKSYYEKIGFSDFVLVEPETSTVQQLSSVFQTADVIHLSGGEVIPFSQRLRATGCDPLIKDFLQRGGVVLGVSAGAMILGSSFKSSTLFKERGEFLGLGLFDFEIIPHANEHFPRVDVIEQFASKNKLAIYAMNDGDIVVVHGQKRRTYGTPKYFDGCSQ